MFLSECTKGSRTCFLRQEPVPDLVLQQWLSPPAHSNSHSPDLSNPFIQNHPPAAPLCPSRAFSISPLPQNICLDFSSAFSLFLFFFFATRPPTKRHANCWCNFPGREENVGGKWKENVFSWNILVSHIHIWSGKQWERRCLRKQDNELLRATHQIKEMQMLLGLGEDCKES